MNLFLGCFFSFTIISPLICTANACYRLFPEFRIHITNDIQDNITVHCQSKDDDLGYRTLHYQDEQYWHFCEQVFFRTLYFCHFWWGSKDQMFDVFNGSIVNSCERHELDYNTCYWLVRPDGFYFSKHHHHFPSDWEKKEVWRQK